MKSRAFTDPLIPGHFGRFPSVRNRDKTKTFPKLIQSKALYTPRILRTMIGGLRAYSGVGRLMSLKSRAFTDPWIHVHFGHFALGAQPRQD